MHLWWVAVALGAFSGPGCGASSHDPDAAADGDADADADGDEDVCSPPYTTSCDGSCVDTASDAQHCGSCWQRCEAGVECVAGRCGPDCGALERCGDSCADTDSDRANCGACGVACDDDDNELCRFGQCVCVRCSSSARCDGDTLQTCTDDADGCGHWADSQDCSMNGGTCELGGNVAACTGGCNGVDICDPDCGIVGGTCRNDRTCELNQGGTRLSLSCLDEETYGFPGGYCAGVPSLAQPHPCDPEDDRACPEDQRGVCVVDTNNDYTYCFRGCDVTDENWTSTNCGCRAGYECELSDRFCMPGCRTEEPGQAEDCCRRWEDQNDDGAWTPNELVDIANCDSTCDPNTFRCTNDGADGAVIGGTCLSNLDCTVNGRCLSERGTGDPEDDRLVWEGGYCVLDACDLDGRECPGESNCVSFGSGDAPAGPPPPPFGYYPITSGWASGRHPRCLASCTVADRRIVDPFADHNPQCREGYGCTAFPSLIDNATCVTDDDCEGGHCIGGVCNGNASCVPLVERLNPHIRTCDTASYPGTGCPGDDVATAGWDETQRCEDDICQAPCDAEHSCAGNAACRGGYCEWSNVGGPCADLSDPDLPVANAGACVSPYGQGFCAQGGVFSEEGTCLLASCNAAGMEGYCGQGKVCADFRPPWARDTVVTGPFCFDRCHMPPVGCEGIDNCQGEAIGCRTGFACHPLQEGDAQGICLASCSVQGDADQFCDDFFRPLVSCNLDTGTCVE